MSYEDQGSGFDPGAAAHERQGRERSLKVGDASSVEDLAERLLQALSGWDVTELSEFRAALTAALKNVADGR